MNVANGFHPVQTSRAPEQLPEAVTLRAYEVYTALHGAQPAMVTGGCRGGFGLHELIAYLYARSFPRVEWDARFEEALRSPRVEQSWGPRHG